MKFDWASFFRSIGVPFIISGKNVAKGHINCKCPFCGPADPSMHMGCDSRTGSYGCWRNKEHRSGGPAGLIQRLKGCSWEEARQIAGDDQVTPPAESIAEIKRKYLSPKRQERRRTLAINLPDEFREIAPTTKIMYPYIKYLENRGFKDYEKVSKYYKLRACFIGEWKYRVILPFIQPGGEIIGWQGRAIADARLRYLTYPNGDIAKRILFNRGRALEGDTLVVVEGPFDCLKVDYYGKKHGIRSVATLGTAFTDAQVAEIFKLAPRFKRVVLLFDPGAFAVAYQLKQKLSLFRPILAKVPEGVEDPGALDPDQVVPVIRACIR